MKLNKLKKYNKNENIHGITLIALVVTIVILIILAAVGINMTVGENGLFTKAKEAKKAQVIAETKEKIGTEILAAQIEATERDEELEQAQIADIVSNYGELQEDGDTIIFKDIDEKVSLLDIYSGTTVTSGSYSENKAKIELLETQVANLEQQLEDSSKSESEKSQELNELKESISDGKSSLASAITAKGVTTSADATFETMANNISSISSIPLIKSVSYTKSGAGTSWSSTSYSAADCGFKQFTGGAITDAGATNVDSRKIASKLTFSSDMQTATISTMTGDGYSRNAVTPVSFTLYGID